MQPRPALRSLRTESFLSTSGSSCCRSYNMSQYPSMPPPGAYVPPNQNQNTPPPHGYGAQQQQQGYQQPQGATTYQSSTQGHGQPSQQPKASGGTFGQMMNQAVTTSKPMLNKLSKTISSKLGNKPSTAGTPQHLQSYQNYQQHYGQQTQSHAQSQSHTFNPQVQQTQQQQQQQPQVPSAHPTQQLPYQQSSYGNGQSNYFMPSAPATLQTPYSQPTPPPQQPSQSSYNGTQYSQGANTSGEPHGQIQQGQYYQGQTSQPQAQGQSQQQPLQAQYTRQQMGVVGRTQHPQHTSSPQSPQIPSASPHWPAPQQAQWHSSHTGSEQSLTSPYQQQTQSYFPNSVQNQSTGNSQHWPPMSPAGPGGQTQHGVPPTSISPPPPPFQSKPAALPSVSPHQSQSATPAPQSAAVQSPTEFIAELPADLGSLSIADAKPVDHAPAPPSGQHSPYQAYQPSPVPTGPSSPGFTIARRAVSVSSAPYADPWRFADPLTELPTREFYVIADLLFEALDRKFEPQNTGMLEASKVLRSWIDLSEDAIRKLPRAWRHSRVTEYSLLRRTLLLQHLQCLRQAVDPAGYSTRHGTLPTVLDADLEFQPALTYSRAQALRRAYTCSDLRNIHASLESRWVVQILLS